MHVTITPVYKSLWFYFDIVFESNPKPLDWQTAILPTSQFRLSVFKSAQGFSFCPYTVKTGVLFRHLLRHRSSAWASVILTLKSVYLSVKTTLRLSYRVLEVKCLN
jgi:hypothetical protein